MGNIISNHKNDYGVEVSEKTRSILKLDAEGRMKALRAAVIESKGSFHEYDEVEFNIVIRNDYFIIAFFENIITFSQAKKLRLAGSLFAASNKNAIIGIRENLFTMDDLVNLNNLFYIRVLLESDNGLYALRNNLITLEGIKSLKNDLYFKYLMTDAGIQALETGDMTVDRANAYEDAEVLKQDLEANHGHDEDDADTAVESVTTNRPPNNDPEKKIKFNTMLRYLETQYNHDAKKIKKEISLLKTVGLDSEDDILRFYKIHDGISFYGLDESYDHLLLLDVVLEQRKNIQIAFEAEYSLGKLKIIQNDMVVMIDKTIAQWVQSGCIAREEIENRGVYATEELNRLLSQTYTQPQLEQHTLAALSQDEMQDAHATREAVVERLLADKHPSPEEQKNDLLKLFSLRRYYQPTDTLRERMSALRQETWAFLGSITQAQGWQNPDILAKTRGLFIRSLLITEEILASLEVALVSNDVLKNPNEKISFYLFSLWLVNQSRTFCRDFIYHGMIDMYPFIRAEGFFIAENRYELNQSSAFDSEFLKEGTPQAALREMYNIFIQKGFMEYYGNTSDKGKGFINLLAYSDSRFVTWTSLDRVKPSKASINPMRFFNAEVQQPRLTYKYPATTTRPT